MNTPPTGSRHNAATILTGHRISGGTGTPAERLCHRHLTDLGAHPHPGDHRDLTLTTGDTDPLTIGVDWAGPLRTGPVDEVTTQARCGLMAVHGRREGTGPRRIGVDYATTAAGVLAATAALAALLARARGRRTTHVATSVTEAALLCVSHYLATATAHDDDPHPLPALITRGTPPPFQSADGIRFEIECLTPDSWQRLWTLLGAPARAAARSWFTFDIRFPRAEALLPDELHTTTRTHPFTEITSAALEAGAAVSRLRDHQDRITELGLRRTGARVGPPWSITPLTGHRPPPATTDQHPPPAGEHPLAGLHVVELGRRIQGPVTGMVLRRLGAKVTRIEPPGGDPHRGFPPMAGDCSAPFLALNRGKHVAHADLRDPRGRDVVMDLVRTADVFLHNLAPGKPAELGLGESTLTTVNPRLVYAQASAWNGTPGPAPLHGTDFIVQAYAGLGETLRPPGEPPAPSLMTLLDFLGGLLTAEGVLAALLAREHDGHGRRVESGLLPAADVLQAPILEALATGREHGRRAGRPTWTALDRPLRTADGWLTIPSATTATHLHRATGTTGTDDLTALLTTDSATTWAQRLRAADIAATPVCTNLADLGRDPEMAPLLHHDRAAFVRSPWRFHRPTP